MTNKDLFAVRWEFVKQASLAWFGGLDSIKPKGAHQVVMAAGVVFLLICQRFDLEPRRLLDVAGRMIQRKREVEPQYVRGMEEWLREELHDI